MNYLYKEKVRKYIIENFPLAIEISNIAPIFLIGGALRHRVTYPSKRFRLRSFK